MNRLVLAGIPVIAVLALAGCAGVGAPGVAGANSPAKVQPDRPAPGSVVNSSQEFFDKAIAGSKSIKTVVINESLEGKLATVVTKWVTDATDPVKPKYMSLMTSKGQAIRYVFDGQVSYIRTGGKAWVKLDPSKEIPPTALQRLLTSFEGFRKTKLKVVYVGEEEVGGVRVSRYSINTPSESKAPWENFDIYMDDHFRPIKVESNGESFKMIMEASNLDAPVDISTAGADLI